MKKETKLTHFGSVPFEHHGAVNIPPYRASTILHKSLAELWGDPAPPYVYGRSTTPSIRALEASIASLEGGVRTYLTPSGLSALSLAFFAIVKSGDHILVADSVYGPTRAFCNKLLSRFNIETQYYDPLIGGDIKELIRPNTSLIFTESPGSITFEIQDIPAITAVAQNAGIKTIIDNTWGALINFNPFKHGIDISVQAATKYIIGHSDALLGSATSNAECAEDLRTAHRLIGFTASPDDIFLALRGLRTLSIRLVQHEKSALQIAAWLQGLSFVREVLYPPLPGTAGHDLWKRDFEGGCGLLGLIIDPIARERLAAMCDEMRLFGLGYSWGGYESLLIASQGITRTIPANIAEGQILRLHIGLEHVDDLQQDLADGFTRAGFKV